MTAAPATPESKQTAQSAVAQTAIVNLGLSVLAIATGITAARLLGPASRGHLAAAQVIGGLIAVLGTLGLGEALVYFVGQRRANGRTVLYTATALASATTCTAIALGLLAIPLVLGHEPDAVRPARVYALIGITFVWLGFPITLLRASQRYRQWNVLRTLAPLSWLAALGLLALGVVDSVTGLIAAFLVLQASLIPLAWRTARRHSPGPGRVELRLRRPMIAYSVPLFLAGLPLAVNARVDQFFLAGASSAEDLGRYAVSVAWAGLGLPIIAAIGAVLFPRVASASTAEVQGLLSRSSRAGIILAVALSTASAALAPLAVPLLFGQDFKVSVGLPIVLAAAAGCFGVNGLLEEGLRGAGEPRSVLIGETAGVVTTLVLLFLLVPRLGIAGAAIASLIGAGTVTAALTAQVRRRLGVSPSTLLIPRMADLRAVGAGALTIGRQVFR